MPSHMIKEGASLPGSIDAEGGGAQLRRVQGAIRAAACLGIGVVLSFSAACSGSSSDIAQPPAGTSTTPSSSTTQSDADRVLAQYRGFWALLPSVAAAPAAKRSAMLKPYAANPELTSLLTGMKKQDQAGQRIYGRNVPRPSVDSLSAPQRVAVIRDCQDSSHSGVEQKSDHRHLTVGTARNLVVTTMRLGDDGTWRVSYVTYPKAKC